MNHPADCPRCHGSGYTSRESTYGGTITQTCHWKREETTMKLSDLAGPDADGGPPMTDLEALAKAREWFGESAYIQRGTERGGATELGVGTTSADTIYLYGTGRTWEECFANVPKLYRPAGEPDLTAHNRLLRDALLLASAALPPGSIERREAVAALKATEPTEPSPT